LKGIVYTFTEIFKIFFYIKFFKGVPSLDYNWDIFKELATFVIMKLPRKLKKKLKQSEWKMAQKDLLSIMLKVMTDCQSLHYPMSEWQTSQKVAIKDGICHIVIGD
jgi:hypothetical protein